jgi:hypothetical protein
VTTFSVAILVLALVGGFAGWLWRRAACTDPAIVLRDA